MNTLNTPIAANTALLLLGYLNKGSKLYFPKFGDESLGWLPPYTFKGVYMRVLAHAGGYTVIFFKATDIHYKLRKTNSIMVVKPKEKTKRTHTKRKANLFLSIIQNNIKIAKIRFFFIYLFILFLSL